MRKPIQKAKTMALAWIYLKTFGQITKSLCDELFWIFKKEDFKQALASFIFYDIPNETIDGDIEAYNVMENIKMRFNKFLQAEYNGTISDWSKEIYKQVCLRFNIFKFPFQHKPISKEFHSKYLF